MGEHVTKIMSNSSFHTNNISTKFHRNVMAQFNQKCPNFCLNDGHSQVRLGEHMTILIAIHSFSTKKSKYHWKQGGSGH